MRMLIGTAHQTPSAGQWEQLWTRADSPVLRVALTPSFYREVCVAISHIADSALVSVVALAEQLWPQRVYKLFTNRAWSDVSELLSTNDEPTRQLPLME